MNKKVLIVIIAILALILIAGLIAIVVMSGSANTPDDQAGISASGDAAATADPTTDTATGTDTEQTNGNDGATDEVTEPEETTLPEETYIAGETAPIPEDPDVPDFPDVDEDDEQESGGVTYLDYHNMTATQQKAFIESFGSYDAFFAWHEAAYQAYLDGLVEIGGDTTIDGGDLSGGN